MVVLRTDLIKCVVLGDDNVGKTSLLMNYATNRFPSKHVPSVFDNYAGSVVLSGRMYNLQLIDTCEDESEASRRQSYPGTDVFVVCFSVVKPETFHNVQTKWIEEIRNNMGDDMPFILVGTQADLRDDDHVIQNLASKGQRPISEREATSICRRIGAACYIECSPAMKKKMRRVMNDAFDCVFSPKEQHFGNSCSIL